MDARLINPFLNATVKVLETMAFVKPVPGKPFLKTDRIAIGDVSGIIGITGDKRGAIVLSLSSASAIVIVSSMLGEQFTEVTNDIKDAVGEMTNMISGDARRQLSELGITLEAGTPTVISGKGHEIASLSKGPCIAIPFTVDGKPFVVEASFDD